MKNREHKYLFANPIGQWHWWFAWLPVKTWDGRWVWLKKIQRRLMQTKDFDFFPSDQFFEYFYPHGYVKEVIND